MGDITLNWKLSQGALIAYNTANFQSLYFNCEACQEHISQILDQICLGLKLCSLINFTLKSQIKS